MKNPRPLHLLVALVLASCASGTGTTPDARAPETPAAPAAPAATDAPAQGASDAAPEAEESPAERYLDDPVAQKRGSDLFRALCTGYCHSTNAGEDTDASYLFDCNWSHASGDQEIFAVISEGLPETRMQGFGGKLPDEELWKIVSFLRAGSECTQ